MLTVRQPWAWAIIHGEKTVENRVRNIAGAYRGPVLIHAAKAYAAGWESEVLARLMNGHPGVHEEPQPWRDHAGEIIGVVDLVDVHRVIVTGERAHCETVAAPREAAASGACSHWAEKDAVHLVLANPRALDQPIPYTGALGLRKTDFAIVNDCLVAPWGHGPGSCTPYGCEPWCEYEPVAQLVASS